MEKTEFKIIESRFNRVDSILVYIKNDMKEVKSTLEHHSRELSALRSDVTEMKVDTTDIQYSIRGINKILVTHSEEIAQNTESITDINEILGKNGLKAT